MNPDFIIIGLCLSLLALVLEHFRLSWKIERKWKKEEGYHRFWIKRYQKLERSNRTLKGHLTRYKAKEYHYGN